VKQDSSFVFLSQQSASELAHIQGEDRHQIRMRSLEEAIEKDNPVRVVEAFEGQRDLSPKNKTKQADLPNAYFGLANWPLKTAPLQRL
jgi:hypothetical protein